MIYIALCDDNEKTAKILYNKVKLFLNKRGTIADITLYSQSQMLQFDIQDGKFFDLILSDIEMNRVFLYFDAAQNAIGTVTIKKNEICRLFVLPSRQGMGLEQNCLTLQRK